MTSSYQSRPIQIEISEYSTHVPVQNSLDQGVGEGFEGIVLFNEKKNL